MGGGSRKALGLWWSGEQHRSQQLEGACPVPGTGVLRALALPSPQPGLGLLAEEAGVPPPPFPWVLLGPDGEEGCFNLSPPACILSWSPGPATVFTLSPVYFASSAHTAFADTRSTVGGENFFLLCSCRKCGNVHGSEADIGKSWVSRPQFRGCG